MDDKLKSGTIIGVGKTQETESVKPTQEISEINKVESIKGVSGVSAVGEVGSVRMKKTTRLISPQERERLLQMITNEADSLFGEGDSKRKDVAQKAVKMAIDMATNREEEE